MRSNCCGDQIDNGCPRPAAGDCDMNSIIPATPMFAATAHSPAIGGARANAGVDCMIVVRASSPALLKAAGGTPAPQEVTCVRPVGGALSKAPDLSARSNGCIIENSGGP